MRREIRMLLSRGGAVGIGLLFKILNGFVTTDSITQDIMRELSALGRFIDCWGA